MMEDQEKAGASPIIRPYTVRDLPGVRKLQSTRSPAELLDPEACERDLDDICGACLSAPKGHFWVAELRGRIVGLVAVAHTGMDVAHVRHLLLASDWLQTDLACRLIERAVRHCVRCRFLKVVLNAQVQAERVVPVLASLGYQYARTSTRPESILHFYLDLYSKPARPMAR
jgi:hypothetical protein